MNLIRPIASAFLVAVTLSLSPRASGQDVTINDAQCFLVANLFAAVGKSEAEKLVAQKAVAFYLGRLMGTNSEVQAELSVQQKTITDENNASIMTSCARAMKARAREIQALQEALVRQNR